MKAIEYKSDGIKCDSPNCDFADDTVTFEDLSSWLNRPCPKCGGNLLTEKDFKAFKYLIRTINFINIITKPFMFILSKGERVKMIVDTNGTGKLFIKKVKGDMENGIKKYK